MWKNLQDILLHSKNKIKYRVGPMLLYMSKKTCVYIKLQKDLSSNRSYNWFLHSSPSYCSSDLPFLGLSLLHTIKGLFTYNL